MLTCSTMARAALLLVVMLWVADATSDTSNSSAYDLHNYRAYPCLPRNPRGMALTHTVFWPPQPAVLRAREWPALAEYSVALNVYMLGPMRADMRMLWLFNRAWGMGGNGTHLKLFWKESKVRTNQDRWLLTAIHNETQHMVGRWSHIYVRLFEEQIYVYLNGHHIMTALGASPWVDFTGFYASSVSTVADPKAPVPTRSVYFDFAYYNFIVSDWEADQHRARGAAVLSKLSPHFYNQDCALLLSDNEYRHEGPLVDWTEWNDATNGPRIESLQRFWARLTAADVCSHVKPAILARNSSKPITPRMFAYYPCVPRQESVLITKFAYQPVDRGFVNLDVARLEPRIPEYSIAMWIYLFPDGARDQRTVMVFEGSWGLKVAGDGTTLNVFWEDSLLEPPDRMLDIALPKGVQPMVGRWTHVALRIWETNTHVLVDGFTAQRIISMSPNVERPSAWLGALPTLSIAAPAPLRALLYKLSYFNHIISDEQLTAHRKQLPLPLTGGEPLDTLIASDTIAYRPINPMYVVAPIVALLLAVAVYFRETVFPPKKMCSSCKTWSGRAAFDQLQWMAHGGMCAVCRHRESERAAAETERQRQEQQAQFAAMRGAKKDKLRKRMEELNAARARIAELQRSLEHQLEVVEQLTAERDALRVRTVDMEALHEQLRAMRKAERDAAERAQAERQSSERELLLWRQHVEAMRQRERVAREDAVAAVAMFEAMARSGNVTGLLRRLYELHPPKDPTHRMGSLDSIDKACKLALIHYHPDKQDALMWGVQWLAFAERICTILNAVRAEAK